MALQFIRRKEEAGRRAGEITARAEKPGQAIIQNEIDKSVKGEHTPVLSPASTEEQSKQGKQQQLRDPHFPAGHWVLPGQRILSQVS